MTQYLLYIVAALALALTLSVKSCSTKTKELARLDDNQRALMSKAEYYKTREGEAAAGVQALTLKCGEYEQLRARNAAQIRRMGIKVKRLESVSSSATSTLLQAVVPTRDTTLIRDTVLIKASIFEWADPWISINGVVTADSASCRVSSCDTLTQIVHRVAHKFLFFRWGCKAVRQEIISSNPHTRLTFTEFIKLQK